jgi:hypothetical protein
MLGNGLLFIVFLVNIVEILWAIQKVNRMELIFDEFNDCWIWVTTNNHDIELSPRLDTEEDAQAWYNFMRKIF